MTDSAAQNPVLTFEGKRYDLNTLPNELKELVRGMQVADAQLRMHETPSRFWRWAVRAWPLSSMKSSSPSLRCPIRVDRLTTKRGAHQPPFLLLAAVLSH